ncbi:trypsin-like serine protease [Saccharothrix sp. BKS2]|uniref:S1 family peptidase n=1 Tax=Saccharothrix sp. BKS2 TaxID=3064400 RepID=UPI0039E9B673
MSRPGLRRAAGLLALVTAASLLAAVPGAAVSGGGAVADGTYAFAVKLEVGGAHGCSGALVAPQWVITAANCFPENAGQAGPPKVAATAIVGRADQNGTDGHAVSVVDLLFRTDRNVALAKLATPIADIAPVAIGSSPPTTGELLRIAGYGRTNVDWVPGKLHSATVSVQSMTANTLAVIGNPQTATTTCKGDAGGPTLRERNGTVELIAVHHTSWQAGCLDSTETRQGATETRVDDIASWIGQRLRGDAYTALATPTRLLDTRGPTGGHPQVLTAGEIVPLTIPDLPAGASAVAVNLTGVDASAHTFLTAYGDTLPTSSNLNIPPTRPAAVMAVVPVGTDRKIRIRNNAGTIHALVDLLGYYSASGASTYQPKDSAALVLDTRTATGGHQRPFTGGETFTLPIRGVADVPSNAVAVAVNVTGTQSTHGSFFTVFGQGERSGSTLNVEAGEDRAAQSIVPIGSDGAIRVFLHFGQAHALVSVLGYFVPGDSGSRFVALPTPTRIVDTRNPESPHPRALTPGEIMTLPVNGLPAQATAAAFNLTGVQPSGNTVITAWSHDVPFAGQPSTMNVSGGEITSNASTIRLGSGALVDIRNSVGTTHVVVDMQGYYTR